jgi:hypothetical protein
MDAGFDNARYKAAEKVIETSSLLLSVDTPGYQPNRENDQYNGS